ncbi:MAG: 23S rRNA (adenine(2503)-C(2))-methyltransferase RlmN [Candidatus Acidiferrum sp.]
MSGGNVLELLGKSKQELRDFCQSLGEPPFRGSQLYRALYSERKLNVAAMTNLPAALRSTLSSAATITLPTIKHKYMSSDGSVRYLFGLPAPEEQNRMKSASVEAVFMPSEGRQTICISTQAGCPVNCQFCLTAQLGLIRNLTPGEILAQVLLPLIEMGRASKNGGNDSAAQDALAARTNVVLMGQGEPLLNFDNTFAALRILLDPDGTGLSPKHVTLSTSGVVPGIDRMGKESVRPKLAISLNASNDEQRDVLMPLNKKYPLKNLIAACRRYPLRNWEHITFEYVMLGGVNDAAEDARRVVKLLAPLKRVKVNLIPWNPGELPFHESKEDRIEEFRRILTDRGVPAFVRYSRGRDVMAACGQLALQEIQASPLPVLP